MKRTDRRSSDSSGALSRRRLLGASIVAAATVGAEGTGAQDAFAAEHGSGQTAAAHESLSAAPRDRTVLCLLGTAGGPPPVTTRTGTAAALSVRGRVYVVDCGRSAVTQYGRAGLKFGDLAGVFITHLHIDHIADYPNFVLLAAHGRNDVGDAAPTPFPAYGPGSAGALPVGRGDGAPPVDPADPVPGLRELTRDSLNASAYSSNIFSRESGASDPRTRVQVHEITVPDVAADPLGDRAPDMEPFPVMDDGTVRVSAVLVPHGLVYPSFAYRFDTPDGSVVFSGDTAPSNNLVRLARGADILVHEAIDLDFYRHSSGYSQALLDHFAAAHTDVSLLGQIAERCGVSMLVLTHLVPADTYLVPNASWRRRAAKGFSGRVVVGNDLDRIPL
ncbi:MBL fold metallo-hydrolase [Streptomyces sp. NPDC051320]|uniref:MBL fold metallo-hydrolase n=1 Tax=Streptomyces sp. NPDC051320 TaxID=3154644 RepID=UPI00341F5E91